MIISPSYLIRSTATLHCSIISMCSCIYLLYILQCVHTVFLYVFCVGSSMCMRAYPNICLIVTLCVHRTRQWCAMPLTKQVGQMSMGCDSDNTTPHYQLTPAETQRARGGGDEQLKLFINNLFNPFSPPLWTLHCVPLRVPTLDNQGTVFEYNVPL